MIYIVMDLEWNSAYGWKIKGFMNEIIEIGAVMLDENLRQISTFSALVRSQLGGGRLRSFVKELTNITREELEDYGIPFTQAAARLRQWIGGLDRVLLTWGDGDIRVLLSNTRYFTGSRQVPYLRSYMDLQQYFMHRFQLPAAQQVGLAAAAERLGIDCTPFDHHRALDDSRLGAECLRQLFRAADFSDFVRPCNVSFFARLEYKPRMITDLRNPLVDQAQLIHTCQTCGVPTERLNDWRYMGRGFQALFRCPVCGATGKATVGFKKLYDSVSVKRSFRLLRPEEMETLAARAEDGKPPAEEPEA
ncbi:MAG: exonuclease domain-containing protein [Oscillospiraceae bacterium]|nr:exonuclease domain-containing protein [Oscillospiraceae bacterium]